MLLLVLYSCNLLGATSAALQKVTPAIDGLIFDGGVVRSDPVGRGTDIAQERRPQVSISVQMPLLGLPPSQVVEIRRVPVSLLIFRRAFPGTVC